MQEDRRERSVFMTWHETKSDYCQNQVGVMPLLTHGVEDVTSAGSWRICVIKTETAPVWTFSLVKLAFLFRPQFIHFVKDWFLVRADFVFFISLLINFISSNQHYSASSLSYWSWPYSFISGMMFKASPVGITFVSDTKYWNYRVSS